MKFRWWVPRQMWKQLAIVLALSVTLPLMALGYLLIDASQVAVKTSVLRNQEQLVVRAASEVGLFIDRPKTLLRSTAAILGRIHANVWRQETVLVELALNEPVFSRLSVFDMEESEVVSSEPGRLARNQAWRGVFKKAAEGSVGMSEVMISADYTPYIVMGVPIRQLGRTIGVLIAEVNLRGLWEMVDNIRIGRTGKAYVVSGNGVLIAHEDKKKVLSNEDFLSDEAVRAALAGKTGSLEYKNAGGGKWLKAYAPVPLLDWGIVVSQSAEEAYSFSSAMKLKSWILIVISLLLAVVLSALLARLLVQPIRELQKKTGLIAQGQFDPPMVAGRKDELGDLIEAFNQMAEKLKKARESEKLTAIGQAAAAIAHELKNSLVMASTYIGLLPQRLEDKDFLKRFSKVVSEELEGWKSSLQDISDFSRQSDFRLTELNVQELMEDVRFLTEGRLAQHGIRLEIATEAPLPPIQGNYAKLKQALMNLILNALEAMPKGGHLKILVKAKTVRKPDFFSFLEIRVEDEGSGVPPEKAASIFEPFFTTKNNGLGLGLSITKGIIEKHRGRIWLDPAQGKGAVFLIHLPADMQSRLASMPRVDVSNG